MQTLTTPVSLFRRATAARLPLSRLAREAGVDARKLYLNTKLDADELARMEAALLAAESAASALR